jgi:hypothetical protein
VFIPSAKFLPDLLAIAFVYNSLQDWAIICSGYLKYRQITVKIKLSGEDTGRPSRFSAQARKVHTQIMHYESYKPIIYSGTNNILLPS